MEDNTTQEAQDSTLENKIDPVSTEVSSTEGHKVLFIVALLLFGVLAVSLWYIFSFSERAEERASYSEDTDYNYGLFEAATENSIPEGIIYLSLLRSEVDPNIGVFALYLNENDRIERILGDDKKYLGIEMVSKDEAYVVTPTDVFESDEYDDLAVHTYNFSTGKGELLQQLNGTAERHLDYSKNSNKLIFARMMRGETLEDYFNLSNWDIVLLDPSKKDEKVLAQGAFPHWLPGGKRFLYMASDGLHINDLSTVSDNLLAEVDAGGEVRSSSMFTASPDGRYVVWTTPSLDLITVFKVVYNNIAGTVNLDEIGRIHKPNTQYYWPVFSPDSSFYVVQAIDELEGTNKRENARLEIRPVESREVVKTISVPEGVDFLQAFTDDWTE